MGLNFLFVYPFFEVAKSLSFNSLKFNRWTLAMFHSKTDFEVVDLWFNNSNKIKFKQFEQFKNPLCSETL